MEVVSIANGDSANWAQRFAESLSRQRTRVGEFLAAKRQQLEQAETQLAQHRETLTAEWVRGRDELQQELNAARQREAAVTAELTALRSEHRQVTAELATLREAETHLREVEQSPAASPVDAAIAEHDDCVRRYESAMADVRRLQSQNAELRQQLSATTAPAHQPEAPTDGVLDWEVEKQRVLAALEAGALGEGEGAHNDRPQIEEIVHTTEQVAARKDKEIADLKHLLRHRSCSVKSTPADDAALAQILDKDASVREEREALKRLQDEWREKLREAEVDISIQRANLARERAELEEKLFLAESRVSKLTAETGAEKPAGGRWLTRLGLKQGGDDVKPRGKG